MSATPANLVLCWVGRTTAEYAQVGLDDYLRRIRRFRTCEVIVVPQEPARDSHGHDRAARLDREGSAILQKLERLVSTFVVALDPSARQSDSSGFASIVQQRLYDEARTLVFVLGGPDGLAPNLRTRANAALGISRMTLPHDMARLVLAEQLYRAFTIIHRQPYAR